jgi:BolA protein
MDTVTRIRTILTDTFQPTTLELIDDSAKHAGHAGVRQHGGGHFYATIVSDRFQGKNHVQRHQLVYQALGDMLKSEVHALSIKALTTLEYQQKETS